MRTITKEYTEVIVRIPTISSGTIGSGITIMSTSARNSPATVPARSFGTTSAMSSTR